jgi:cobalt-zinc-cadmium efflux system outer membrane protein
VVAVGCVHYQPLPITSEAVLDDFEARRLDAPDIRQFLEDQVGVDQWPPSIWDLESLTLAALYFSPDLDVARARWGVSEAGLITAGARPEPSLAASIGYDSTSKMIRPWIPEVVLSLPVETAGKRGIRINQARALSQAAQLDVLQTAWDVRGRLRRAFVDLFRATATEAQLLRLNEIQLRSLELLEAQLDAGAISANELTQARIAAGRTRLAALEATSSRRRARVELASAVGVPSTALDGIEVSFDELEHLTAEPPTDEIRRLALVHRTDILSALAGYEAAQAALQLEIAKQYPDLDIGAGYQLDQVVNKWTLGLNLILPVFNRNKGPIAEAEAARAESAARFLALQSRVVAEVDGAAVSYRSAVEAVTEVEAMLAKLEQRSAAIQASYTLGAISRLEVLGAEIEEAAGRVARIETLASAQAAAGELENAVQNPLDTADWYLVTPARAGGVAEAKDDE